MQTYLIELIDSDWIPAGKLIINANEVKEGKLGGEIVADGVHIVFEDSVKRIAVANEEELLKEINRYVYND